MSHDVLSSDGFAVERGVLSTIECAQLVHELAGETKRGAGSRCLLSAAWCQRLAVHLRLHPRIARFVPSEYVAAQCTYFEKSRSRNWLVSVHQDLSIPVAQRTEAVGLQGWSEKEGALFVQAPVELLERLVAVRVHLDRCGEGDGPLQVVPGSHAAGCITPETATDMRRAGPVVSCTAEAGDALLMRPLLLHASSKASGTSLRRVLHFLFGPRDLPHGLRWQHAV